MAVIHISEAEAANTLPDLIAKVRAGNRVEIESGSESFAIVPLQAPSKMWTISEAIRRSEARGSKVLLDDKWSDDLEAVIRSHEHETLGDAWE